MPRDSAAANTASPGGHTSPATSSVLGRGEGAEGQKGGRSRKGTSVSTGPGLHTWDGQWPHPADLDHGIAWSGEVTGTGRHLPWLLPSQSHAKWHRLPVPGGDFTTSSAFKTEDADLKRVDAQQIAGEPQMENRELLCLAGKWPQTGVRRGLGALDDGRHPASELTTHHLSFPVFGAAEATGVVCLQPTCSPAPSSSVFPGSQPQ